MSNIIWSPQPRQAAAMACPFDEVFFGGARGGGKTDWVVGEALSHAMQYGRDAKILILRKQLGHFQEIKRRCRHLFMQIPDTKWSESERTFTFPNGAFVKLNYLDRDDDVEQYWGNELTLTCFDEVEHWPTSYAYDWLWTCQRSTNPNLRIRRIATGNPGGVGAAWVKARFIDPAPPETPITEKIILPDNMGEVVKTRVFIPSKVTDNKYLGKNYIAELMRLPDKMRMMHLDGDWSVTEGAFFNNWESKVHVCEPIDIPSSWQRWMGFDWGTWHPYAALWLAQAPWGDLYIYRELYGNVADSKQVNVGLNESPNEVARKILNIEAINEEVVAERWCDGSMFDGQRPYTIGDQFAEAGLLFRPSPKMNKAAALQVCKESMNVLNGKSPLHVFSNCRNFIRTVPNLQFHPRLDGVYQEEGENHLGDAWTYAMRRGALFLKDGSLAGPDARLNQYNLKRNARYREISQEY